MTDNHITVRINSTDLNELTNVVNGADETHDLPGSVNGQPITVRFYRDEDEGS